MISFIRQNNHENLKKLQNILVFPLLLLFRLFLPVAKPTSFRTVIVVIVVVVGLL